MSAFLTLLALIFVIGFWIKSRKHTAKRTVRYICCLWGAPCNLDYTLNTFLVLSCLSGFVHLTAAQQSLTELQTTLENMKDLFNRSDACLYAPLITDDDICINASLHCYLLELEVILYEENGQDTDKNRIYNLKKIFVPQAERSKCPPCEAHELTSPTAFLARLKTFLQNMISRM